MIDQAVIEKFWQRVVKGSPDECWPWQSYKSNRGYGYIHHHGKNIYAHRIAAFIQHGEPPSPEHQALHSCDNKPCANPHHCSWGTRHQNMLEARQRGLVRSTKLTPLQVSYIKRLIEAGYGRCPLSRWYCIDPKVIYSIKKGHIWRDIEPYKLAVAAPEQKGAK